MLFVIDTAGVPSVAKIIKLERGSVNPLPGAGSPIKGIGGRCLDIQGGVAVNRSDLWMNTCNGSASQNWLYAPPTSPCAHSASAWKSLATRASPVRGCN